MAVSPTPRTSLPRVRLHIIRRPLGLPFALPLKKLRLEGKAHPKLFYPVLAVLVFFALRKKYAGGYKSGILGKIGVIFESIRTRTHQLPTTPQTLTNKMGTQPKRKKQRSSWGKDPSVPGRPYSFDSMNWGGRDSRYTRIMLFSSMMFVQLFFKLLLLFGAVQQKMMPVPYSIRMPATPM